jgi:transposase
MRLIMTRNETLFGIDVSKATLVCACHGEHAISTLANAPQPISAWLATLPKGAVLAMEATGHYHRLLAHLAHTAGFTVYVLNPQTLKHYAQAIGQRGKTDPCDARMIVRYLAHERTSLRPWQPPAPAADQLSQLLERRHTLVNVKQMLTQSLQPLPVLRVTRASLLESLRRTIRRLELLIRHEISRLPDAMDLYQRLQSIKGIGPIVAAQLVAVFHALHFTRVDSFIAYTGLDPRPHDSGARVGKRRLSKKGPPLLRRQLYNAAMAAANSKLFKPTYAALRARGLQTTEAIVVLARKLARIAFSIYRYKATFDPKLHVKPA